MASVKIKGFDTDKLLREIKKDIERDLKKNPERVLDSHAGDVIEGDCSKCGKTTIEILPKGQAKCTKCGRVSKVDLKIHYK